MSLVVRSERVVLPDGSPRRRTIHIRDGRIVAIGAYSDRPAGARRAATRATASCCPGLVDTHVHINDPGRADWEGFEHATRAAAAGGVTTLVDMPLNSIPATTTVAGLERSARAARGRVTSTSGSGAASCRATLRDLEPLARAGVLGFKCFLCPSGVDEFPHVAEADLREALPVLATLGVPLLAHAELPGRFCATRSAGGDRDPRRYATWLDEPSAGQRARPPSSCSCGWRASTGARVHIVHLASADALPIARGARARPACRSRVRDLPALPDVCGRGDRRRRDGVQVRAADPRARQSRAPVASAGRRRASTWSRPTIRRRRRRSSTSTTAISCARGAASRRCSSGWRSCGPARRRAVFPWSGWRTGWPRPRRGWPAWRQRARSPSDATPTSSSAIPTANGPSRPRAPSPASGDAVRWPPLRGQVRTTILRGRHVRRGEVASAPSVTLSGAEL